jgi:transposase
MEQPLTIGLDLAKNVFQVHGVDASGQVVCRRQLRRAQRLLFFSRLEPCLVGMQACSGAHHWGREIAALGHGVRLMPPAYVKPYVKRGKRTRSTQKPLAKRLRARPCASCR